MKVIKDKNKSENRQKRYKWIEKWQLDKDKEKTQDWIERRKKVVDREKEYITG